MPADQFLRSSPSTSLGAARALAHRGAQLVTMAARSNLDSVPDDSHSNLGWSSSGQSLQSHSLESNGAKMQVALAFSPLQLNLVRNDETVESLRLDDLSHTEALAWLDLRLAKLGLSAASRSVLPYDLPADVEGITTYDTGDAREQLASLAAWFDTAHRLLSEFASSLNDTNPGPSPVRCWPHHFDIATYVALDEGSSETARGIGVGMSPGDESYGQPYFYVNPWPYLNAIDLPDAPAPGHWHTDGFVGAIATGEEILKLGYIKDELSQFLANAFEIGRGQLGA